MKFKIQDLKKPTFDSQITKALEHEGLSLTLCIKHDEDFMNALAKVQGQFDKDEMLSKDSLRRGKGQIQSSEALLFVIGEYAIGDWNVTDMNDKPIDINGDHFLLVLQSVDNLPDFLMKLINTFNEAMTEFGQAIDTLKKKSKHTTTGKK